MWAFTLFCVKKTNEGDIKAQSKIASYNVEKWRPSDWITLRGLQNGLEKVESIRGSRVVIDLITSTPVTDQWRNILQSNDFQPKKVIPIVGQIAYVCEHVNIYYFMYVLNIHINVRTLSNG